MLRKPKIIYCSWSKYKKEEWEIIRHFEYETGSTFDDVIEFEFRNVETREPLLRDISAMVHAKAISAYQSTRVPCVVEHAGVILKDYEAEHYPGGLTQPMWDALGAEKFVATCAALGGSVTARAVVGYCDGASVKTFSGETSGSLKSTPAGTRAFYWDTVFCPDGFGEKSYAEIADGDLSEKMKVSQSFKAFRKLVDHCQLFDPLLFPGR